MDRLIYDLTTRYFQRYETKNMMTSTVTTVCTEVSQKQYKDRNTSLPGGGTAGNLHSPWRRARRRLVQAGSG